MARQPRQSTPPPVFRDLRVFAVDPGATTHLELLAVNETTLRVPWETLQPGPVGEYVAVLDKDDQDREVFPGVNLNSLEALATDGLPPSDSNPQFRQQMVYAVTMRTIKNFERALGRVVHWAPTGRSYRQRLNLYPHYE